MKEHQLYEDLIIPDKNGKKKSLTMTWLGTSGIYISDGETGLLIDPYATRFSLLRALTGRKVMPDLDSIDRWIANLGCKNASAVIVSHSHFDHSMDAPFFAEKTGAHLVGSESTLNVGRGAGLDEVQLRRVSPGDRIKYGRFTLRFLESRHGTALWGKPPFPGEITAPIKPPAPAHRYRVGTVFSIIISHPRGTVIHHGSAGFGENMYENIRADALLIGISLRKDTNKYLEEVALKVKPRILIPIHFDNFFRPVEKGITILKNSRFSEFIEAAGKYGEHFRIGTLPLMKAIKLHL